MTPNISPADAAAHTRKLDRATAAHEKTRRTLDEAIADARADGLPLTTIAEHTPYSREWARKIANRVDAERCNAVGDAPNSLGTERCKLPAGHEGRHEEGINSWPQRPAGSEEKSA
ncbi:hypothetical protein [Streptomyces sp. NBC_01373]|uniref:hypothetical protein n=1 Tax=Streptomyces sp. NBC_01373 TaxID=2903843 RepID=UPI0022519080|nr:hypothetical protein [Streptomyces sp. NBC_01373]MCX4703880.1 hypothetical protein [Streptomyces sp. NBC_01373]